MHRGLVAVATLLMAAVTAGCFGGEPDPDPTPPQGAGPTPQSGDLPADVQLARSGRWLAPFDGQVPAVNIILLDDGRVLYWSGVEANESDGAANVVFFDVSPADAQSRVVDLSGDSPVVTLPGSPDGAADDLFCAGATVLPDGRVLAVGASEWHQQPDVEPFLRGGTDARLFDPATDTWTRGSDMLFGRWYPSAITLPDGKALVASGIGSLTNPTEQWPQLEVYDPAADTWTYLQGSDRLLPLYPRITVVPGGPFEGHLFYNTVGTLWGPFGEHPEQAVWSIQQDLDLSATEAGWSYDTPSSFGARQHGSNVMLLLDPARDYAPEFVSFGGTLYQSFAATPFTERIDLATDPPVNTIGEPMASPRWHHNGVLLPTGEILAVGGGLYDNVIAHGQPNVAVLPAEMYDPGSSTWTTLASMSVERMYHSTAVLLPDGRVLAGGHVPLPNPVQPARGSVNPQIHETRLEVFEPPYLFRGTRPVIEEAPRQAAYGSDFTVRVTDPDAIERFVMMRPGATTHAFDSEQRGVILQSEKQPDGSFLVHAPSSGLILQPGTSMLFAVGQGEGGPVPSVAHMVRLA
ncbi:MAG TPA: galactose oxidase-like domain-containing protein [Candidatus Thermoplasmatota archaeon]|nr:galactose oxidase-like domain-containing protein [Candidatus Thermoplasmatota archaeon]